MSKLIHPELSYRVRGVLLNVYNTLGCWAIKMFASFIQ